MRESSIVRGTLAALILVTGGCGGGRQEEDAPQAAPQAASAPRAGVWFNGDFESGTLDGWARDSARRDSIVVVEEPVRRGRYAARVNLETGDVAADKERVELKLGDRSLERERAGNGSEVWYGWSLFVPADFEDPPEGTFQIVAQWHHRPPPARREGASAPVSGAPPLTLDLARRAGRPALLLSGRRTRGAAPRTLGEATFDKEAWTDVVFHVRWSTRDDGFVEGWMNGRPMTAGKQHGRTLYGPGSNYLRLGLYRNHGVPTANDVYYDEVRLGDSLAAVSP